MFSLREINVMTDFMKIHLRTLKASHTQGGPGAAQKAAKLWEKLTEEVNACGNGPRTVNMVKQVKEKWRNMVKTAKSDVSAEKSSQRKTGGGPPRPEMSQTSQSVASLFQSSASFHGVCDDADTIITDLDFEDSNVDAADDNLNIFLNWSPLTAITNDVPDDKEMPSVSGTAPSISGTAEESVTKPSYPEGSATNEPNQNRDVERMKAGKFKFVLCHPEQLIRPEVKKLLMAYPLSDKISTIVVDEAHCILTWGSTEFRPAYQKLGLMRAVVPQAKILALTATATLKGQADIISSLHMHDTKVISASPDRTNVFLEVKRRPPSSGGEFTAEDSVFSCVDPLFKELSKEEVNIPKTVVYTQLKWCGILHNHAKSKFGTAFVRQYHSPQSQAVKSAIVEEMAVTDVEVSTVRLLIATETYGMGMDVRDIRNVIHVGPPSCLETFVQEIGRCGRDGGQGKSCIYFNPSDLSKCHLSQQMKDYCTTEGCRRELLLKYFSYQPSLKDQHYCCDNCLKSCSCEMCKMDGMEMEMNEFEHFDKNDTNIMREMLISYFEAENSIVDSIGSPELETGLSQKLIDKI